MAPSCQKGIVGSVGLKTSLFPGISRYGKRNQYSPYSCELEGLNLAYKNTSTNTSENNVMFSKAFIQSPRSPWLYTYWYQWALDQTHNTLSYFKKCEYIHWSTWLFARHSSTSIEGSENKSNRSSWKSSAAHLQSLLRRESNCRFLAGIQIIHLHLFRVFYLGERDMFLAVFMSKLQFCRFHRSAWCYKDVSNPCNKQNLMCCSCSWVWHDKLLEILEILLMG